MRPLIALLVSSMVFAGTGLRASAAQTSHDFKFTMTKKVSHRYLRSLPEGYDAAGGRRWPLILFLHGAGERGTDLQLVAKHGPPKLLAGGSGLTKAEADAGRRLAREFIVISPQCSPGEIWDDDAVLGLLDAVCNELKVDGTRVYLTGLSMGGYGTWSLAMKHPERFAAVVPICGGGRLIDVLISRGPKREKLQTLGVWAFHGAKDPTVPVSESERMVETLRKAGANDVKLTIYPEAAHNSWAEAYANLELYTWLLKHVRAQSPRSAAR